MGFFSFQGDSNYLGGQVGINNNSVPVSDGLYYYILTVPYNQDEDLEYIGDVTVDTSTPGYVKFLGEVNILR